MAQRDHHDPSPLTHTPNNKRQAGLDEAFKHEVLDGENKYACDKCGRKTAADRSVALRTLPPVLFVSLNRFEYDMLTAQRRKVRERGSYVWWVRPVLLIGLCAHGRTSRTHPSTQHKTADDPLPVPHAAGHEQVHREALHRHRRPFLLLLGPLGGLRWWWRRWAEAGREGEGQEGRGAGWWG